LPLAQALAIARRVARVLAAVHAAGYVHRDVKSEHVWLSPEAGALRVSLIDFGVCQPPGGDVPQGTHGCPVFGTPGYLAPEQAAASGPASPQSDLYGLGATLFEALTGRLPFSGANAAVLLRLTLSGEPEPLSRFRRDVPRAVEKLLQSLLALDPAARPLNARLLERSLRNVADTPLDAAELALVSELRQGEDATLVETLDEGRPTRSLVHAVGA
jgi:serine/threonine protein kinase